MERSIRQVVRSPRREPNAGPRKTSPGDPSTDFLDSWGLGFGGPTRTNRRRRRGPARPIPNEVRDVIEVQTDRVDGGDGGGAGHADRRRAGRLPAAVLHELVVLLDYAVLLPDVLLL